MEKKIKILHLEDSPLDAELIHVQLQNAGVDFDALRVDNKKDFTHSLQKDSFDLILADRTTPTFDGIAALRLAQTFQPATPFIFVSGTLEEEVAIESLKDGATDYVLKHRLSRLVPAVSRAIHEIELEKAKKILQEQLIQSQKMEVLGNLARGIAHDFNNLLTLIQSNSEMLKKENLLPDDIRENADAIQNAVDRGVSLVKQLITFSRKSDPTRVKVDINRLLESFLLILRRTFSKNIVFETHLTTEKLYVSASPDQLHQVFLNLCMNARHAMPTGGTLSIGTQKIARNHFRFVFPQETHEEYVSVIIAHTGEIADVTLNPSPTANELGKGMDTGWMVTYDIIQRHQGAIEIENKGAEGGIFHLFFPMEKEVQSSPDPTAPLTQSMLNGNETLLLVDDEWGILNLLQTMLQMHGYRILTAIDAFEAIDIFRKQPRSIDLVVTDFELPKLDGFQMFLKMKKVKPEAKALLCSGIFDPDVKSQMALAGIKDFVEKPYNPDDLLEKIGRILHTPKMPDGNSPSSYSC